MTETLRTSFLSISSKPVAVTTMVPSFVAFAPEAFLGAAEFTAPAPGALIFSDVALFSAPFSCNAAHKLSAIAAFER